LPHLEQSSELSLEQFIDDIPTDDASIDTVSNDRSLLLRRARHAGAGPRS
jgi:hypothetical protein